MKSESRGSRGDFADLINSPGASFLIKELVFFFQSAGFPILSILSPLLFRNGLVSLGTTVPTNWKMTMTLGTDQLRGFHGFQA